MNANAQSGQSPIDTYERIDLSIEGPIAQNLLKRSKSECQTNPIHLVDRIDTRDANLKLRPANLTPHMNTWLSSIGNYRSAALDHVAGKVGRIDDNTGVHGVFLEREQASIVCKSVAEKRQIVEQHREKNQAQYQSLSENITNYQTSKRIYNELKARHQREAKLTPRWYWLFLLLILCLEILFNYETIDGLGYSPAATFAATAFLAFGLTLAAHFHGKFLAQFHSRFGPHAKDQDRRAAWNIFSMGTLCLSTVLGVILYARTRFYQDQLIESLALGTAAPGWLSIVAGSLSTNVVIWTIGVALSFMVHDKDHNFPEALETQKKAEKILRSLQKRLNAPLSRAFEKIDADSKIALEQAAMKATSFSNTALYVEYNEMISRIKAKDNELLHVLEAYRQDLIDHLPQDSLFEQPPDLPYDPVKILKKNEYAALPLTLTYS